MQNQNIALKKFSTILYSLLVFATFTDLLQKSPGYLYFGDNEDILKFSHLISNRSDSKFFRWQPQQIFSRTGVEKLNQFFKGVSTIKILLVIQEKKLLDARAIYFHQQIKKLKMIHGIEKFSEFVSLIILIDNNQFTFDEDHLKRYFMHFQKLKIPSDQFDPAILLMDMLIYNNFQSINTKFTSKPNVLGVPSKYFVSILGQGIDLASQIAKQIDVIYGWVIYQLYLIPFEQLMVLLPKFYQQLQLHNKDIFFKIFYGKQESNQLKNIRYLYRFDNLWNKLVDKVKKLIISRYVNVRFNYYLPNQSDFSVQKISQFLKYIKKVINQNNCLQKLKEITCLTEQMDKIIINLQIQQIRNYLKDYQQYIRNKILQEQS